MQRVQRRAWEEQAPGPEHDQDEQAREHTLLVLAHNEREQEHTLQVLEHKP